MPLAAVRFVAVFVVVGPSDLGLCLTGALHYMDLLTEYEFKVQYRPGNKNKAAEEMSRFLRWRRAVSCEETRKSTVTLYAILRFKLWMF